MDDTYFEKPALTKAVPAGLFSGIFATCAGLLYDIIYRVITHE